MNPDLPVGHHLNVFAGGRPPCQEEERRGRSGRPQVKLFGRAHPLPLGRRPQLEGYLWNIGEYYPAPKKDQTIGCLSLK